MSRNNTKFIILMTILIDLILVSISWLTAYYLRFHTLLAVTKGIPQFSLYLKLLPFVIIIWLCIFNAYGVYERLKLSRSPLLEGVDIVQACLFSTLAFIAVTFFYHEYRYSRLTLVIFAFLNPLSILLGRSLLRKGLRLYKRHRDPRRVLVIGSGKNLENVFYMIQKAYIEKTKIIGAIIIGSQDMKDISEQFCRDQNIDMFQFPTSWNDFIIKNDCDSVVIGLPHQYHDFIDKNLGEIAQQVTSVKILPDLLRFTKFGAGVDIVNKLPVLSIHESPLQGFGAISKRLLDIFGAIIGLFVFFPVMAIIAIIIKISSDGPVVYKQERLGIDGKAFTMFKFRSMPLNVEKDTGAKWASKHDQRPTAFGKWIRKLSFDELPQLINVIRGDMSLVGPRPERPVFVHKFRKEIPGYMLRHKVKSGMTGWAQIQGWRGNTSIDRRIECDLFYIQNWSIWLDIKIILMTFLKGFVSPNAY